MKHVVIAPVGDHIEDLFVGIKEFPTDRIILITPKDKLQEAENVIRKLDQFKIKAQIHEIRSDTHIWEATFEAVSDIKNKEKDKELLINVSTGDRDTRCAVTSAAFVNGIKAFGVENDEAMLLPVLKFSYYKILSDKKLDILKTLVSNPSCCASLEELSKKTSMSLPLISYHINGTMKSEGLKELGLVDTLEQRGRMQINLSMMGRLLIKGYLPN